MYKSTDMKKTLTALVAAMLMSAPALADNAKLKETIEAKMKEVLGPRADVTEVVSLGEGQIYEVVIVANATMRDIVFGLNVQHL